MEIKLDKFEIQEGFDRLQYAEGLILQMPITHPGVIDWLSHYGISPRAKKLREERNIRWNNETRSSYGSNN